MPGGGGAGAAAAARRPPSGEAAARDEEQQEEEGEEDLRDGGVPFFVNRGGLPVDEPTWERMWRHVGRIHPEGERVAQRIRGAADLPKVRTLPGDEPGPGHPLRGARREKGKGWQPPGRACSPVPLKPGSPPRERSLGKRGPPGVLSQEAKPSCNSECGRVSAGAALE